MSGITLAQSQWLGRIKKLTGVDRAIAYTVAARVAQILGSTGTVLLIVRFLSPIEQGYYYTLLSLVTLQMVFEMGFSFVILQLAAHECVHLKLNVDGTIEGDIAAYSRLASVLQKTLRWYSIAAVAMVVTFLPIGETFLARHRSMAVTVAWQGPWVMAVLATGLTFFITPFLSFLEGCGQVREVAGTRMLQALAVGVVSWVAIVSGHGLYAPALVNVCFSIVGFALLLKRRTWITTLLRRPPADNAISWRREVWPFQWQIGVSWLCAYFTMQVFTPALFALRGPVEAGQMGMSMSIAGYTWMIVIAWMSTKATPFGRLIAQKDFGTLDRIFFRTFWQSFAILCALIGVVMGGVLAIWYKVPSLSARIVSPLIFLLLLLTAVSTFVVQSLAVYLRSYKREPFLSQSLVVALLTMLGVLLTVQKWGISGLALTYFVCSGIVGLIAASFIFQQRRSQQQTEGDLAIAHNISGMDEGLVCSLSEQRSGEAD